MWYHIILNKIGSHAQKMTLIQQKCHLQLYYYINFPISEYLSSDQQITLARANNKMVWFYIKISTFESIYLKSLQSGQKFELSISNYMWPHFSFPMSDHIFIFLVTYLIYIFFFLYVAIFQLLWRQEGVGIYCRLIPDWIKLNQARILFTTQYRMWIHNEL